MISTISIGKDLQLTTKTHTKQSIMPRSIVIEANGELRISSLDWVKVSYSGGILELENGTLRLIVTGVKKCRWGNKCDKSDDCFDTIDPTKLRFVEFNGTLSYIMNKGALFNKLADLIESAIENNAEQQLSQYGSGYRVIGNAMRGGIAGVIAGGGFGASIAAEEGSSSSDDPMNQD